MTTAMNQTAATPAGSAHCVIEGAQAHGVRHVFGISGRKIDQVHDVLEDLGPYPIVCRHERNATFTAGAIGRLTGAPGVVLELRS
jgi:acetolactate synthase-1/2/3 large subunit